MSFFAELKRRNVFKVGLTYIIVAWIIIQVADTLLPTYGAPAWVMPVFTTVILLGLPLALVLSWALEISPAGISVTHDGDTTKGSPSGLLLNFVIMGVMACVIIWLVIDRSTDTDTQTVATTTEENMQTLPAQEVAVASTRLPNSIAVLPFENLSPDPDNAYFAAGIHDTVLHELAKISDMNVIARTSVMQYANTTLPVGEIADTLNVGSIMEGTVQYAEGQVRITAQLINPDTGSHIWSGNFDRPFADVFTIQSEIAQSIANAIGAELLPQELASIRQQYTQSEEAYSLYLQARALVDNISPVIIPEVESLLLRAIDLDPTFAHPYAMLAFNYALSLGYPTIGLSIEERESKAREYAQTTLNLDPNQGLAYGALAMIEQSYLLIPEEQAFWEIALEVSPNDSDVLDDAIRFFATSNQLDRAELLASRVESLNPGALMTVQLWLAYGSGDLNLFTDFASDSANIENIALFEQPFVRMMHGAFEAIKGNNEQATMLLNDAAMSGITPDYIEFAMLFYAYGRLGDQEKAQLYFDEYMAFFGDLASNTTEELMGLLATGQEEAALNLLKNLATNFGPGKGSNLRMHIVIKNLIKDPILDKPEFVEARQMFGIPID